MPTQSIPKRLPTKNYLFGLSTREWEGARLIAKGLSNRQIANTLGLQEQSIKNLVTAILKKMQCTNRVQIALKVERSRSK